MQQDLDKLINSFRRFDQMAARTTVPEYRVFSDGISQIILNETIHYPFLEMNRTAKELHDSYFAVLKLLNNYDANFNVFGFELYYLAHCQTGTSRDPQETYDRIKELWNQFEFYYRKFIEESSFLWSSIGYTPLDYDFKDVITDFSNKNKEFIKAHDNLVNAFYELEQSGAIK